MKVRNEKAKVGSIVRLVPPKNRPARDQYGSSVIQYDEIGVITEVYSSSPTLDAIRTVAGREQIVRVGGRPNATYEVVGGAEAAGYNEKKREIVEKRFAKAAATTIAHGNSHNMGTDPEIFVTDAQGEIIPAFTFLSSKKQNPRVFYDGFQSEFTTPALTCHEQLVAEIRGGLDSVLRAARLKNKNATLDYRCVLDIPKKMLKDASDEHAGLGCAPSLNIYPGVEPINVPEPRDLLIRFAGCHIHLGCGPVSPRGAQKMVRTLDAIWGVLSVAMFRDMEDPRRRQYYGRAGEFRLPRHGLEYRVPSSAVLAHPALTHLSFDLARCVAYMARHDQGCLWEASEDEVRDTVNNLNLDQAIIILERNKKVLRRIIDAIYGSNGTRTEKAERLIFDGAKNLVPIDDMAKNWQIGLSAGSQDPYWNPRFAALTLKEQKLAAAGGAAPARA